MSKNKNNPMEEQNANIMVPSSLPGIREFRPGMDKWRNWREVLDSHFIETSVEEDRMKVSILLRAVGLDAYGLLRELCFPDLPITNTYNNLCRMLDQHYSPPVIIFRERRIFFESKKMDSESVSSWYARTKKLAMECRFGENLQQFVLNKFVTGLDGIIYERLCEEDENLTLESAYKKALTIESKMYVKNYQESDVNFVKKTLRRVKNVCPQQEGNISNNSNSNKGNKYQNSGNKAKKKCVHCGWKNHASEKCKYRNSKCHKCQKVGHLASVCSSTQINTVAVTKKDTSDKESNLNFNDNANFSI